MAYLKYNAYAHRALEEGLPEIAQVFQEVAGAETIHGLNHLRVCGDIKSTLENLRTVTEGESKEFSTMYPRMIRDAQDEGRKDAADSFSLAMERERHHLEVFTQALDQLEARRTVAVAPPSPATETTAEAVEDTLGRERAEFAPVAANDLDTFVNATISWTGRDGGSPRWAGSERLSSAPKTEFSAPWPW